VDICGNDTFTNLCFKSYGKLIQFKYFILFSFF
jgi:hypothetical protein